MPDWVSILLSGGAILGGVTYQAGRIARALEGVEAALEKVGVRQAESDGRLRALEERQTRSETKIGHLEERAA